MSNVYCFDTNVLGWAVRKTATAGRENMLPLAQKLLQKIDDEGALILIPAVVMAEISVKMTDGELLDFKEMLPKKHHIPPFDANCGDIFSKIWRRNQSIADQIVKVDKSITKTELKFDYQIIAIAIANNATCIYSTDGDILKLGRSFLSVKDLSEFEDHPTLI